MSEPMSTKHFGKSEWRAVAMTYEEEIKRLRAALRRITTDHLESDCHECIRKINIARGALGDD